MDKVAVLLPCYNEAVTISNVVKDFKRVLPDATVYVYDNNSTDNSAELAREAGAIVRHEYQQGKGYVIRRMFAEIDAECYIIADSDSTYSADDAPALVDLVLNKNVDMVVGDRLSSTYFNENKRPFHNFGNSLVKNSVNFLFGSNVQDIMTGYRAFSFRFVKTFPIISRGFEIETEMTIHAVDKNMYIENVPINYSDRPDGSESKLSTFSDGFKVIKTILYLFSNYRPFVFYGIVSMLLLLISFVVMIPIVMEYFATGLVPRFPTLIVCGFIALTAILSFFTGVILNNINYKNHQDFEIYLYQAKLDEKRLKI